MHLVVIAWLYVTFTMALTMGSPVAGIAFFLGAGLAPVAVAAALAARRRRRSVRVGRVHRGDDRHAEPDQ